MNLRHALARHGFESNDDYDFALRCLFDSEVSQLRVLHVDGAAGRRKTAFATALAHALEYPHAIYHDFSRAEPPHPMPVMGADDDAEPAALELPMSALERAVTEACAYSEGERTILILDQLQAADFADQIRLHQFITSGHWQQGAGIGIANARHLLLVLMSETPLYHSLARASFRIWTDAQRAFLDYRPEDYGLGQDALPLFAALSTLLESTALSPTPSEFSRVLEDLLQRVRSEDQLRQTLYGRIENVNRDRLNASAQTERLGAVIDALGEFLGQDHIELG